MISSTIRAWNTSQNRYPNIFLYQNTKTGIFSITEVEAEVTEDLLPLEQLCLELTDQLGSVTRLEAHAISGISIEICEETLQKLQYHGLLRLREYDRELLDQNIDKIIAEVGEDWITPYVKELRGRTLLKQYVVSEEGKSSVKTKTKTVRQNTDLNIVITGSPFYLFHDQIDLRSDGYELVEMDRDLVKHVLGHSERHAKYTGIKPLSIGPATVSEGKEVGNSQFWITLQGDPDLKLDQAKFDTYLSSSSFERWSNPSWNEYLSELVPEGKLIKDLVIQAMSETWMMVENIIEEGLSLDDDQITWILKADLEMQKLIYNVMPEPVSEINAEIKLRLPDEKWNVVIILRLEPWDDLSKTSLRAGRFHASAPRKGFTLEEGFVEYQEMMREWDKPVKRQEYLDTLETLVKYDCLIERIPKVSSVIVDVDDVLSKNRRGRQKWQFNRLREIETILEQNDITDIRYLATERAKNKVDELDEFEQWLEEEKIEIIDNYKQEVPEIIDQARKSKSHYLGEKKLSSKDREQEYSRTLNFHVGKKRLTIPGLEPFYDWRLENIFEQMYNVYYE